MGTITAIRGRIGRVRERLAAHATYFDCDRQAGRILDELATTTNPADRAPKLYALAELEGAMAHAYPAAFGPDPIESEGGRDMAESCYHSATLYRLLADVEEATAYRWPRRLTSNYLESEAGPVLDRMAGTDDPVQRGALLDELYDAVVDVVGDQAAEVIACLPAPGHEQVRTLPQILEQLPWARPLLAAARGPIAWRWLIVGAVLIAVSIPVDGWPGVALALTGAALAGVALLLSRRNAS